MPGDAASNDLRLQANGAYVACGYVGVRTPLTPSVAYSLDWHLVEFTHRGDTLRTKRFGVEGDLDAAVRLIPTAAHGLAVLTEYEPRSTGNREPRLVKLDSLWREQWRVTLPMYAQDLRQTQAGDYLVLGNGVTAVQRVTAAGQLDSQLGPYSLPNAQQSNATRLVYEAGDPLMLWGYANVYDSPAQTTYTQRFYAVRPGVALPAPYNPADEFCRYPPQLSLGWQPNAAPDSLVLVELSTAGPRYAQNVTYRWALGDGTVRETAQGGTFRYRYAQVPPAGTPVTLTVSNNLGCVVSETVYPWGRPTAAQQGAALAAQATLAPNPASHSTTLRLAQAPAGPWRLELSNALGQVLRTEHGQATGGPWAQAVDLQQLPAGLYVLRVYTSAGSFSKRLVRQ